MATIVNDRDVLLQATVPRYAIATDRAIVLTPSSTAFLVAGNGTGTPSTITFTATLLNMTGVVNFTASGGSTLSVSGNIATLAFGNMVGVSTSIIGSITADSVLYQSTVTITKIADGITSDSTRICYTKTTLTSLSSTPATITSAGDASFPPDDSWGAGTHWVNSPPIVGAGETIYQSDGIFSPLTGATLWTTPYLSSLKVGELSALSAYLGKVEITTGGWLRTAGVISYAAGNGFWMGENGTGVYKMRIGNPAGNYMAWDGSSLRVVGDISGSNGTFSGTLTASAINAVDTINLAGNAVTVPGSVSGWGGAGPFGGYSGMWQVSAGTLNMTFNVSAPVSILVTWQALQNDGSGGNTAVQVRVNGTQVLYASDSATKSLTTSHVASVVTTVGVGTHQFTLWFGNDWHTGEWDLGGWSITILGVKR